MKIEKGKLYYDTKTEQLFINPNYAGTAREGVTDKIAVYCPTEEDFNYVTNVKVYDWTNDYNGRWDLMLFKELNYISLCINQRGSRESYIKRGYHIITIEEFKKFYPEPVAETKQDAVNPRHYTSKGIQPIDYIEANGLNFNEGNLIKYVSRYKEKNGLEDLKKAKYYLERLIEGYERS